MYMHNTSTWPTEHNMNTRKTRWKNGSFVAIVYSDGLWY